MHQSIVFCSACTMSSQRKFTFAISSPDELFVHETRHVRFAAYTTADTLETFVTIHLPYHTIPYHILEKFSLTFPYKFLKI